MASSVLGDGFLLQLMYMLFIECGVMNFSYFYFNFAGEGQYGKVYTCISVDTGELMAMKEVSTHSVYKNHCCPWVFSKPNVHDLAGIKDF